MAQKTCSKNDFKSIFIFQPGPKLGLSTIGGNTFSNLLPVADKHQVCGQSFGNRILQPRG